MDGKKILIAYFSWSGNAGKVAEKIQKNLGGTIFQIEEALPYSKNYDITLQLAKSQIESEIKPQLFRKMRSIDKYDVIFLGSPNWYSTIAPPVASFISLFSFKGKVVIPFITHGTGGFGHTIEDLRDLLPGANIEHPYDAMNTDGFNEWISNFKEVDSGFAQAAAPDAALPDNSE